MIDWHRSSWNSMEMCSYLKPSALTSIGFRNLYWSIGTIKPCSLPYRVWTILVLILAFFMKAGLALITITNSRYATNSLNMPPRLFMPILCWKHNAVKFHQVKTVPFSSIDCTDFWFTSYEGYLWLLGNCELLKLIRGECCHFLCNKNKNQ